MFQGQEIGIRLTHWAPTGNEVDLEFADFARYFADQPEVGVDRLLHRGLQGRPHADARGRSRGAAAQADRDGEGRAHRRPAARWPQSHTGHLTGSDAVTDAVFRQFGVTRVDGLDELLEVSAVVRPHAARRRCRRGRRSSGSRACASTRSRAAPARTWPTCSPPPACASRRSPRRRSRSLHDGLIPAYLRVSNPVDCGGPPVADARGRQILDVIVADPNDRHRRRPDHRRGRRRSASRSPATSSTSPKTTDKPIFVVWGAPPGTDDTYYKRLLDGGLPVFRTFGNCVKAVRAYVDYWTFAARYRSPFDDAPTDAARPRRRRRGRSLADADAGRGALGVARRSSCSQAYGIKSSQGRAVSSRAAAAVQGRERRSATRS